MEQHAEWLNEGAQCVLCEQFYLELLGYQKEGALVECGSCHQVYILAPHPETGGFPWETEDMPVIEWNYDGPDSIEVNLFGDAPEGDGYSW